MAVEILVHVKLLRPCEHAGRKLVKGDEIDVDSELANWLIGLGVAEKAAAKPASKSEE